MVKLTLRTLVGTIKDKASQSKAAMMSKPDALLSLLRATSHDPDAPPDPKHIAAVLALGRSSRAAASAAIEALMERLARTRDAYVALKCLVAAHHVAESGGFILRDQLAVFPASGGRNYLNLSKFRDASSHVTWELSTWVRWYGQYVECLVSVSRGLGFFLAEKLSEPSSVTNSELIRETESVVSLVEQICKQPEALAVDGKNKLIHEIRLLVARDCQSAVDELGIRVREFEERLSCLSFGESVQLVCALTRLQSCSHRLCEFDCCQFGFWDLVRNIKDSVDTCLLLNADKLPTTTNNNHFRTQSARFLGPLPIPADSLKFGSGRFSGNSFFKHYG